ncbi:TLD-domain-containing protein [Cladochytrium replicatum]|nr:TLD-domain-containing protein [Cladochytrium replicatum]
MKPPPVQLLGRETQTEAILKEPLAEKLRAHMPPLLREGSKWRLIYSMDQHGISMHTLYENGMRQSNLADYGRMSSSTLLVIRDDELNVFGAFGTDVLKLHVGYFGTGECFLWKLDQLRSKKPTTEDDQAISVFHATGANEYLMLCEPHCIAFGGGYGRFGLWIDDQLLNGHSERCATFDNERLSASADFTVLGMEIWGFEY